MEPSVAISTDMKELLDRWYRDISGLFSGLQEDPELAFNEEFYQNILERKESLRRCHLRSKIQIMYSIWEMFLFDSDKIRIAHDMRPLAQILGQMDEIFRGNQPRQKHST